MSIKGRAKKLYSYVLRHDDGAAPNPFWGTCTLTICKPDIRRTANIGDWIVGTGSKNSHLKDGKTYNLSDSVVYAMKVTNKLSDGPCYEGNKVLCVRGWNSLPSALMTIYLKGRVISSLGKAILSYLNRGDNIVMVSTHDVELSDLLKGEYDLYHFSEYAYGDRIRLWNDKIYLPYY